MAYAARKKPASADAEQAEVKLPTLETFVDWYDNWEERTRNDRKESARDYDYYDNLQWTADEIKDLEARGQPVLTKNCVARKVNFILGDEVEKGIDPVARPKTPQHEDDARAATDGLRSTEETQDFDAVRSAMFKDLLIAGYGGGVVEGDSDPEAKTCAPLTHVAWDRLWYDPHSRVPSFDDAKYRGIVVWYDLDDAIEAYPDSKEELEAAVNTGSESYGETDDDKPRQWADKKRKRLKVAEVYFEVGGNCYRACFTKGALLKPTALTGYTDERGKKNVCPLVMASCYVGNKTNKRYGIVRALISPQDEVNKRDSKALWLLSVNGTIAPRDAILDPNKFQTELAKPDGHAEYEPGFTIGTDIIIRDGTQLAASQIQLAQQARADIDGIGPSSANMPDLPESASGKAFIARQKAAAKELAPVFASLRRWDLEVMRQNWMRICQFRTEEWWLRVADDKELTGYRFVTLNKQVTRAQRMEELIAKGAPPDKALVTAAGDIAPLVMMQVQQMAAQMQAQAQAAQGQQDQSRMAQMGNGPGQTPPQPQDPTQLMLRHPLMQEVVTLNQAAKMDVDILIDTRPESTIVADEQFDKLMEMLPAAQASGQQIPFDLILELSSFPDKRRVIEKLNETKQQDPQAVALQQQMAELQKALQEAMVQKTQAEATAKAADAAKTQAETQLLGPKTQAEIGVKQAQSMSHAANAGAKAGGGNPNGFGQAASL